MATIPLYESASAKFVDDGNGGTVARVTLSPQRFGSKWTVTRIVVSTTSSGNNGSSQFRIYRNSEQPSAMIDGTYSGDQDVDETNFTVQTMEQLICVWTKGDLGTEGTVVITGTIDTGRD